MSSIKKRLLLNFVIIIVLTVTILNSVIYLALRNIYYSNISNMLVNQIKISSELYSKYFSKDSLYDNVLNGVDSFITQNDIEVQIFDNTGKIIFDSIGVIEEKKYSDIDDALVGKVGKWIGAVDYDEYNVMAVSYPLYKKGEIIGGIRFVTTLREVNKDLSKILIVISSLGIIVIIISAFISILLSDSIIIPIMNITNVAQKMAQGDYSHKCTSTHFDEIEKLSTTLNYMADEIVKREKLKDEFISSVSHELRTPLTSIKGWAVTLKSDENIDKVLLNDGLNIIEGECDRLTSMVEELLDFSRLSSGKVELKFSEVNIKNFLMEIRKQMEPRASRENKILKVDILDEELIIYTDKNRLKQVFINLLDNAFNFTNVGDSVFLKLTNDNEKVTFVVEDTGMGISEDDLPHVFEKFYKGKSSRSKNGIGLSVCKDIIEKMNGEIKIQSKLGEGTRVIINIPL